MLWKESGESFDSAPLGTHAARCIALIDLGTRTGGQYGPKREVLIRWELPTEPIEGKPGEVHTIGAFYTQSLGEKANLRIMLKSWRGRDFTDDELRGFDPRAILGKACMVSVVEKQGQKGVRHVVGAVTQPPKGMTVPPQINESIYLSLEAGQYDVAAFGKLSEKTQDLVKASPEWKALQQSTEEHEEPVHAGIGDDDVPF